MLVNPGHAFLRQTNHASCSPHAVAGDRLRCAHLAAAVPLSSAEPHTGHVGRDVSFMSRRKNILFRDLPIDNFERHAEQAALPEFDDRAYDTC